jgi:hypothetical protein
MALRADLIQPVNALNLGVSPLWKVDGAGIVEEIGRKTELSDYYISIAL